MEKKFRGAAEILGAISDNTIVGVVSLPIDNLICNTGGIEYCNDVLCNELVGEEYGYMLQDISYKMVGFNEELQIIYIEVTALTDDNFIDSVCENDDYVDNESEDIIALNYNGVEIYHLYKDNDSVNNSPYDYHFTLDLSDTDGFDIRELETYDSKLSIRDNLKLAIDNNLF